MKLSGIATVIVKDIYRNMYALINLFDVCVEYEETPFFFFLLDDIKRNIRYEL